MQEAAGDWEKDNEADELEIKRISPRTFIAIGLLMTLMLGWVLYEALSDKAPEEQGKGVVKVPVPSGFVALEDELKEKANQFLAAENWEDVLPLVRRSPGIEEKLEIFQNRFAQGDVGVQQFVPSMLFGLEVEIFYICLVFRIKIKLLKIYTSLLKNPT